MLEKILLLSRNKEFLATLRTRLKNYGVEVIDSLTEKEQVPIDELRHRYNVIIVDKSFLGNVLNAWALIRKMRRLGFEEPIIAIERAPYDGALFSMLVAGCNFTLSVHEHRDDEHLMTEICLLIGKISDSLRQIYG